jgi:hypothetical protein
MRKLLVAIVLVAVVGLGLWFAFGRDRAGGAGIGLAPAAGAADAPLAFVPADTPYVIANLEALPGPSLDAWMQQSDTLVQLWRAQFDMAMHGIEAKDAADPALKWMHAIDAEFKGKTVAQSLSMLGIDLQGRSAIYGIGLVPVVRMTLGNPDAFRAFVARVEAGAGEKLPSAALGDIAYWQFTAPKAPLRGILALQGKHLVATLAPAGDDAALKQLLGVDKPAASMQDGAALAKINKAYGYTPFATGFVDTTRIVAQLTGPATPLETAFLAALGVEKPAVDAVCQAEYAALAQAAPRLVLGYTTLEPKRSVAVSRLELRGDIAKDLMTLRAPMPGLDAAGSALFNVGVSLKLAQFPPLVAKWAGAVQSAPWKCASLVDLNQGFADASTQLTNPAVFMAGPVFEGLHLIATRFSMPAGGGEPDFAGKLLIGSPSPGALLQLSQNFAPQLAQMDLKPDGVVKPVPMVAGMPPNLAAHAAMTDKLLGLAVGTGEEATLKAAMTVDPARQPLFVLGYSGEAFVQFSEQMKAATAGIEDDAQRAESERAMEMMKQVYALIRRIELRVEFEESGIAFHQTAEMN